jgi:tetratricopeptide (TPR) repeat protein
MPRLSLTLLAAMAVLLPTLAAQHTIGTAFGQTLQGTLLSDDGSTIVFQTDSGTQMTLPYKELDAATIYRLMAGRTAKDDGPGQLKLGDQAATAGLFDAARDAYALAVKDDPSLTAQVDTQLSSLRVAASNSLLAEAKHASEHGRPDVALHDLATLMQEFPGEPAAKEGSAMYDSLHASYTALRSKAKAQSQSQAVQQALAPAETSYAEMGKKIKEGLQNSGNQTVSIDAFNAAIETGKSARLSLKELQGQASTMAGLAPAIKSLDAELVDELVNAYTQLANTYNQRTSYNDAATAVNEGLALQPDNQSLLQLQSQIASNASEGSGEGVAVGGVGVVGWHVRR